MKSVASNDKCEKKELPFPKLMINLTTGNIFLMIDRNNGTKVYSTTATAVIGRVGTALRTCIGMKDYTGSVCLTNED